MPTTLNRFRQPKEILALPEKDGGAVSTNGLISANTTDWDGFFPKGLVLIESAGSYAPYLESPVTVDNAQDAWNESTDADCTVSNVYDIELKANVNKFVIAAAASANDKLATEVVSVDLSSATHLVFFVKSDIHLAAGSYKIMTDDTASCASPIANASPLLPELFPDEWTLVALPISSGSAATISVGLQLITDVGANTLHIGKIRGFATSSTAAAAILKDEVSFEGLLNEDINKDGTSKLSVAAYTHGTFQKARLFGWDSGAKTDLDATYSESDTVVRF